MKRIFGFVSCFTPQLRVRLCLHGCVCVYMGARFKFMEPPEGTEVLRSFLCIAASNTYGQPQVPTPAMKASPACFIPSSHPLAASAAPNRMLLTAGFISPFMVLACVLSIAVNSQQKPKDDP